MGNTVIVGVEMEAALVGAPARVVTVGSRHASFGQSESGKIVDQDSVTSLCAFYEDCGIGTVFSDTTPPIYAGPWTAPNDA